MCAGLKHCWLLGYGCCRPKDHGTLGVICMTVLLMTGGEPWAAGLNLTQQLCWQGDQRSIM